ncbi:endonuclease/exonuclease/phosphatase family protein [Kiloniella majae]|uniref:endonuclease/exonuclease/phosphatase family protein n=1 Tax=Kiloniella majae TaxID=1938558 RepID=UPI0013022B36|nr:endonuclease/exonuclease/phosphatase family protein [Kiloniella majae]
MLHYLLGSFAFLCLLASLIPFIPIAHGAVRVFDFGRLQILTISVVTLVCVVLLLPQSQYCFVLSGMLAVSVCIELLHIIRFTPFWRQQSARFQPEKHDSAQTFKMLVCNVKQSNKRHDKLIDIIDDCDPDILVLMETDQVWLDALEEVTDRYVYRLSCPQDNSYGMFMASRLEVTKGEIEFLLNESIPSFHCRFKLENGDEFDLIAIHPDPPVPHRDTIGRDAEILVAGKRARYRKRPLVVAGDLNDVAWSSTTRRFLRISRLLDPRQGRGMFNSFDARFPFLRWPLDHIFHSEEFELVAIRRQPYMGSDHFPMFYELAYVSEHNNELPDDPSVYDLKEARSLIQTETNRDRRPIGEDWEK